MSDNVVPPWHALDTEEVLERVAASPEGLSTTEVERRLERFGPNEIAIQSPLSLWTVLRHQFSSVVVWLLITATGIALLIGDAVEAAAIAVVLAINVAVGFWTEWRARVAVEALRSLQTAEALVVRDGRHVTVDAARVVPGDVLVLGEGAAVAADARILRADELRADESTLTGESMPVSKTSEPLGDGDPDTVPVADRVSMVFKGTVVVGGAGIAVVTATGARTEVGRIGTLVGTMEHAPTPIERRLDVLGKRLVWLTLAVAALVIAVGLLGGRDVWLVVETGLALAIAAVPEGLPVVATITLAVGMWRMARRNALVRRPPAVEALGSATVICTDKTGTLTSGEMAATDVWVAGVRVEVARAGHVEEATFTINGTAKEPGDIPGLEALLRTAVFANEAHLEEGSEGPQGVGDPTDVALLFLGAEAGVRSEDLLAEAPDAGRLPFSSRRMLMASFHEEGSEVRLHAKGAAERVLPLCTAQAGSGGIEPLDEAGREALREVEQEMAGDGLRVLALATGETPPEQAGSEEALADLTFLGFVGLMDPPSENVAETIARFSAAGVRTVMITGDQPTTARSIARKLGILGEDGDVVAGPELGAMDAAELAEVVQRITVFGRVSPEDKLRIVEALQSKGHVVAMLGDGVNDGPALTRADIGVAMGGRGTDVAKGVADLVLADDRLETVGVAVEEGRIIFDNIRKFVFYLFSCNLSEVGIVLGASLVGSPLPILPLQLLWLNVVTDVFPALALSAEPGEPDVMSRPPRTQDAAILSRGFVVNLVVYAGLITAVTLAVFAWALRQYPSDLSRAVTLSFMTLAVAQLFHALNARTMGPLPLGSRLWSNRWVWGALGLGVALQLAAVYLPTLQRVLGTVPLDAREWGVVIAASLVPLAVGQTWKRFAASRASSHESRNEATSAQEMPGRSS